ncbi:MAG TPA: tetratricopeptide repeat protein [Candidatus Competibacteraceae bacterium]|nr:tetratricopeptide repeat protein [Candidatus Competibacteraceae bacterium]
MADSMIERFEALLARGQDNALVRFTLGGAYLRAGDARRAVAHLRAALVHDPSYSAAWKLLGQALTGAGQRDEAMETYRRGIATAMAKGDRQAAKEMEVFLRRLERQSAAGD